MPGVFSMDITRGNKATSLETPRQLFVLIWPALPHHWAIFLPNRYATSSSGKLWHVRVMDMKVKQHRHRSKNPSKLLKLLCPCTEKGVDIVKENHVLKSEKYKVIKIEDAFATESLIDSITKKIESTFHYEAVHENCQTLVVEVMRELESRGFATREAVDFVKRQSLASVRVTSWSRERRHPLPDMALDNLGPRAPMVDFSSGSSIEGRSWKSSNPSSRSSVRTDSDTRRKVEEQTRARGDRSQATHQVRNGATMRFQQARPAASAREAPLRNHVRELASYGTECEIPGAWVE